jgi:adenylate cyclase
MSDIFISYARSTADQAQAIAEALRGLGYGVWRDDEIPANRAYADVIAERLATAKAVVVIWSAEAVRSQWVRSEAERARGDDKLVQLSVDGARLPMPFDQTQCADLAGWSGSDDTPGWKQVVGAIANLASPSQARHEDPRKAVRKLSICVLPFANMSGDPEQEYFSDGISEDIITDLSKVSALEVTARNTAFNLKGKGLDIPDIASKLSVSHVLEGSVRKAGNRVRITSQLIDGTSGNHVWAERWDRDLTDIFALQDEISQAIVAALKIKLLPEEKAAIGMRGTKSPEAYELFLMAREIEVTGNAGDPRREEAIIRLCTRATEIDPDYARAWALMGFAQSTLAFNRGRGGDTGLAAAERAEALDATLGAPHAVKAKVLYDAGDLEAAFAELEQAIRLEPESREVGEIASLMFYGERRFEEAERIFAAGVEANPADVGWVGMLVSVRLAMNDLDGARSAARTTLERAEAALAHDRNNGFAMSFGVTALAALGETERAKQWINRALLIDPDNLLARFNFACASASLLGDAEGAVELITPVLARDAGHLVKGAASDPDLDLLRDDPRFQKMLADAQARVATKA